MRSTLFLILLQPCLSYGLDCGAFLPTHEKVPARSQYHFEGKLIDSHIRDQCAFGGCWLMGSVDVLETQYRMRTGRTAEISLEAMAYYSILINIKQGWSEILYGVGKFDSSIYEAGSFERVFNIGKEYGFHPLWSYQPKRSIFSETEYREMVFEKITRALAPHLAALEQLSLSRPKGNLEQWQPFVENLEKTLRAAREVLAEFYGEPPSQFMLGSVNMRPRGYYAHITSGVEYHPHKFIGQADLNTDVWFTTLADTLKSHGPLYMRAESWRQITNEKLGVTWFRHSNPTRLDLLTYLSSGERADPDQHAMIIVDYYVSPTGKRWLLLRNSWGKDWGDLGHTHLEWETFKLLQPLVMVPPQVARDLKRILIQH